MSKIYIQVVSEDALIAIKKNAKVINEYIKNDNTNKWLSIVLKGVGPIFIEKKIKIEDFELLENKNSIDKEIDFKNSITLYENLKHIPKFILSTENFWLWLSLDKFYSITREIMPITSESTFSNHYLFANGTRRGIFFGTLSRMFYRVALTIDEKKENKYELTRWIIDNPERFRNLSWRSYSSEVHLVRGIIKGEKRFVDEYGEYNTMYKYVAKQVSMFGSVKLLDAISEEDIEKMVYDYMVKIKDEMKNDGNTLIK